jgi:hypothetical protein
MLSISTMNIIWHDNNKSYCRINQENRCHYNKEIKSLEIALSNTFRGPRAMMIIANDTNIAIPAMMRWFRHKKLTFFTIFLGLLMWLRLLSGHMILITLPSNARITQRHHSIGHQLPHTNNHPSDPNHQTISTNHNNIQHSQPHHTKTYKSRDKAPI